jgi:AcrR family transcriptional regulator
MPTGVASRPAQHEPRPTRLEQKRRTRQHLLDVAATLFAERGFAAATTAEVARAAGVSHGSVFVHFPTREALIEAVVSDFGTRMAQRMYDTVEAGAGVREVLAAQLAALQEGEELYGRIVTEISVLPDAARRALLGVQSAASSLLYVAAEREVIAGTIRLVPMHLLFNTWMGLVQYYVADRDLFAPGASVLERKGEELLDHYMSLLAPIARRER